MKGYKLNRLAVACLAYVVSAVGQVNVTAAPMLECVAIPQVTSDQSPPAIFIGARECLESGEYDKAVRLYTLGVAFGAFDTMRVEDETADAAMTALMANAFGGYSEWQMKAFKEALKKLNASNDPSFCQDIRAVGHPTYDPTYMVLYSETQGLAGSSALVEEFDADGSWGLLLEGMGCAPTAPSR